MKVLFPLLLCIAFSPPLFAAEIGTMLRTATLYDDPTGTSKVVGRLQSGTRVEIIDSKSGWRLVSNPDNSVTGWARQYQVRIEPATEADTKDTDSESGGLLSALFSITRQVTGFFSSDEPSTEGTGTGGDGNQSTIATIGVRGLSESDLASAKPDPDQLEQMKRYASSETRIARFSRNGNLKAKHVERLH